MVNFEEPKLKKMCDTVELPYSWSDMKIEKEFSGSEGCYITANVTIKNVDLKDSGEWKVTFTFTTLDEGKTVKDINYQLKSNEEKTFSVDYDIACGEEYRAEFKISPPMKEVCEYELLYTTKTKKECSEEIKYKEVCN
jgi:hypothetical protein